MSQIKGLEILSTIRYLRKQYDNAGYAKIVENLSVVDQAIINETIRATQWYDLQFFTNLIDVADALYGKPGEKVHTLVARYAAEESFKGVYKIFIRFMSPGSLIKKAPLIWSQSDSTGKLVIVEAIDGYVRGKVVDFDKPLKSYCLYLVSFFERVIELAGGKNVKGKELKCRLDGADCCEFEIHWN